MDWDLPIFCAGQGSKKVPSDCPGQVDFPVGHVTFHSDLLNGQGPRQVICQLNHKKSNLRLAQGKQNLRAPCPKGKLEFKFFFSPCRGMNSKELDWLGKICLIDPMQKWLTF